MSAVLARTHEADEREQALHLLDCVLDDRVPPVIEDALGEMPKSLRLYLANVVLDRISSGLSGDTADAGEQVIAYLEQEVRNYVRLV